MTISFRARVLLLVFAVAVLPLGLIGLWLTGNTGRSGEALLRARLQATLMEDATTLELAWIRYRSALLDLSEAPDIQRGLRSGERSGDVPPPSAVQTRFEALEPSVEGLIISDAADRVIWRLGRVERPANAFPAFGAVLNARVPLFDIVSGDPLGNLDAFIPINALRSPSAAAAAIGAVVTARDPATGALLLPAPFDPGLLARERFQWNDETWMTVRQQVREPSVELLAAAPVAPFAEPFNEAARRGTIVLLLAAGLGLGVAMFITARLTRSLEQLAAAATDVAGGQLGSRVEVHSNDEIGRVARAFNAMTDSLRRTLDQLAERESLAAVNEFAAALAHEVRNPLTSIRLDLQEVEERLPAESPLRPLQARVLEDVHRLDRTVAGALETARSGRVNLRPVDLRACVDAAVRAAQPAFAERDAELVWDRPADRLTSRADPDALERVVLNLLLNAAEASSAGGQALVSLHTRDNQVVITVRDDGRGIAGDAVDSVFRPFFTTRPGGTGVGLAVARRIVTAHGGDIDLQSEPGRGTTVEVRLPTGTA